MHDKDLAIEILLQIETAAQKLLSRYPDVDWKKAKGMRDIITHHYADIHADTVFFTCEKKIPMLLDTIKKIIKDLKAGPSS